MTQQVRQVPDTAYISFSAEINPTTCESLIALMAKLVNAGVKTVHLLISTPGGSVMHGINLYNVLRGLPIKLITHNVGNVDSIGNAIFLAGEERYAVPQARFMFHGVAHSLNQGAMLDGRKLRELLDGLVKDEERIASVIVQRSKIDQTAADELFREAEVKNATEAVSLGLIHEVRDVNIPPGSLVEALVFKR
jgi:ATP-dependent Clp protease, protease subunit